MTAESLAYPPRRDAHLHDGSALARLLAFPELLLLLTGALNLWGLSVNGWANSYYSAAVRSMAGSWHGFCSSRWTGAA